MSLHAQILGQPGRDNALWLTVDSGQRIDRLLFDCGAGCADALPYGEILGLDHLFFSHLHMDHVAGFDSVFRALYNRETKPNRIWGPPQTAAILQHRMQGYLWNLHADMSATWWVQDVDPQAVSPTQFRLQEAFAAAHPADPTPRGGPILDAGHYSVDAITMDHKTPTLAYIVREAPRRNVDTTRLADLGLKPGPWLQQVKSGESGSVDVHGTTRDLDELRDLLLSETPGQSIAYLTDFLLDEPAIDRLAPRLAGIDTLVCEAQYRHADLALAHQHYHMTTHLTATLAARADVGQLILFHLSDRYTATDWLDMLAEAQTVFPATHFPPHWDIQAD